jgi:hypothetical protein
MLLVKLERQEQFDHLKRGDIVVVKWRPGSVEFKKGKPITSNTIWGINKNNELILNSRINSYFIIHLYLRSKSHAAEAYLIIDKPTEREHIQ